MIEDRILCDLYRFCSVLDSDCIDKTFDSDSFYDLLTVLEHNTIVKVKRAISHDLRLILDDYAREVSNNAHK